MRLAKGSQVSGWELEVLEQCRQRGIKNLDQLPMQEQYQPQNQRNYQQSYEVTPPVPTKVEHKVVTNVNLDKQAQLRLILNASFLSGGGIGLLLYVIKGSVMMGIAYAPTLRVCGKPWWTAPGLVLAAGLYTAMTVASAIRHWRGRGGQWKGRTYD